MSEPCEGFDHRSPVNGGETCWRRRENVVECHVHPDTVWAEVATDWTLPHVR